MTASVPAATGRNPEFVRFLLEAGALRFGEFTLKSGAPSPFFINLGELSTGQTIDTLGCYLADAIVRHFPTVTHLFGPAYKGISMATAAAMALHRHHGRATSVFFDRKEAKSHGEGGRYIGFTPKPENHVVLIDDVITSGGTKYTAYAALEETFGVRPLGTIVAVDRTCEGVAIDRDRLGLQSIIGIRDIVEYLKQQGDERWRTIDEYYRSGGA